MKTLAVLAMIAVCACCDGARAQDPADDAAKAKMAQLILELENKRIDRSQIAIFAAGEPEAEDPAPKAAPLVPGVIQPGPEIADPPPTYYVSSPEQMAQINFLLDHLTKIIEAQKKELDHLREQTKPIGSCG